MRPEASWPRPVSARHRGGVLQTLAYRSYLGHKKTAGASIDLERARLLSSLTKDTPHGLAIGELRAAYNTRAGPGDKLQPSAFRNLLTRLRVLGVAVRHDEECPRWTFDADKLRVAQTNARPATGGSASWR